jgi:hypothetical protein
MQRLRFKKTCWLLVLPIAFLGIWLSSQWFPKWLSVCPTDGSAPKAALPYRHRDLDAAIQGSILRAAFPIANTGNRRLILMKRDNRCCGSSARSNQIVVEPGDSTELNVEVDTTQWFGQLDYTVRYTTNDLTFSEFTLRITANIKTNLSPETPIAAPTPVVHK